MSLFLNFFRFCCFLWLVFALLFHFLNIVFPLKIKESYAVKVYAEDGKLLYAYLSEDDKWRFKTSLQNISPLLVKTVKYKEDRFYYYHPGFNPISIVQALVKNTLSGKRKTGASSITQQLSRLITPQKRTYANKIMEVFRAVQLELKFNKDQILELYLNRIPFGGNIEGVGAASLLFLNKEPAELSLAEATLFSIVPNKPTSLKLSSQNIELLSARNRWLQKFKDKKLFDAPLIEAAQSEPIDLKRFPLPKIAPHLCRWLKNKYVGKNEIFTSINYEMQSKSESLLQHYANKMQLLGIRNTCMMIVHNPSGKVLVYVGSQNFDDNENLGQVDGTRGIRSPGSTLKPLIYAMAIDKGLYTGKSRLMDVPIDFNGYRPQNYDKQYYGSVTLEFALGNSLNIPAVSCLQQVTPEAVTKNLQQMEFRNLVPQSEKPGLAMALGGCGANMHQLLGMYSALARAGEWLPLKFIRDNAVVQSKNVLSDAASSIVTQILMERKRPDFPQSLLFESNIPQIAWKTGTSFGRKDAWSIGYNAELTIAVWLGNFDSEGIPELVGSEVASPLLFEIFNALGRNVYTYKFPLPDAVEYRTVCNESGLPPDVDCEHTITDLFIPGISLSNICRHQTYINVSLDSALSYCLHCLPSTGKYFRKRYPNHPKELSNYWLQQGLNFQNVPPHNPICSKTNDDKGPEILGITDRSTYYFEKNQQGRLQLRCLPEKDVRKVYWYVNDKLLFVSEPHSSVFWKPSKGKFQISVADDRGRKNKIQIEVILF